jgi:flavin-binding protein dodecin
MRQIGRSGSVKIRQTTSGADMKDHVYKVLELTGTSTKSSDDAVKSAVDRASRTLRNMRWFQVTETRGGIDEDKVAHWQVTIKVGFTLE